ncbi:MAG: hypothetical protein ACP5MH_11810 [Thermoproteus sp.]
MAFKNVHLFADTSVLARIVYAVAATRVSNRPKPLVEIAMEQGLVIYTDKAVDRELPDALKNILRSADRARHGWPHLDVESMFNIALTAYSGLVQSRRVRVVEDDGALARQRRALESRETRRVCWSEEVMDRLLSFGGYPRDDLEVLASLLYSYDLLATVPRRTSAGITKGILLFLTEDKKLAAFVEDKLSCSGCVCSGLIKTMRYRELIQWIKSLAT